MNTAATQNTGTSLKDDVNSFLKKVNFGDKDVKYNEVYFNEANILSQQIIKALVGSNLFWIQNLNLYKQGFQKTLK